jgi:predicted outer membrane repeat protein
VYVSSSGTFTMQGSAVVSGNTASSSSYGGGGVFVYSSGTFTMHDSAVISGNTASSYGGGVYVYDGTFKKEPRTEGSTSGIIYGSDESGVDQDGYDLKNTATYGSAIYVDSSKQKDTTVWETTSLSTDSSENWE